MRFAMSTLATTVLAAVSLAAQAAALPSSSQVFETDQTFDQSANIVGELTFSGKTGNEKLTFHTPSLPGFVIQGEANSVTFSKLDTFTLTTDYATEAQQNAIYPRNGGSITFDGVKNIYLGTAEDPMAYTNAIHNWGGKVTVSNAEHFEINARWGLYCQNQPGGENIPSVADSVITIGSADNPVGEVVINTVRGGIGLGGSLDKTANQGVEIFADSVSIKSSAGSALDIFNTSSDVDNNYVRIHATNDVVLSGKESVILINDTGDKAKEDYSVTSANGSIHILGEQTAVNMTGDHALTLNAAESIQVNGDINAENGTIVTETPELALLNGHTATIGTFDGGEEAHVYVEKLAEGKDTFTVATNLSEYTTVEVGTEVIDNYDADELGDVLTSAIDLGKDEQGNASKSRIGGHGTNVSYFIDEQGNETFEASDLTKATTDLAVLSAVAWRNELTSINDRMATLRTLPTDFGVWARYNGGEYQYDERGVKNQFNTIEVGADTRLGNGSWILGGAFSYTKGDGEYDQGETDSDTFTGALYALWTHEKGSFVDVVAKVGRISSDFDFHNRMNGTSDDGSIDQTGFIFGVETGHRFTLPMNTFLEPQVQLTYSHLSSEDETTGLRRIEVDSIDSLVGRVGLMAGINCPNDRGAAYVKVSALHDFQGDVDASFSTNGHAFKVSEELDDTWFEFAVGANFKVTDGTYLFADVQKSAGGDVDLDWRANVGAKFLF